MERVKLTKKVINKFMESEALEDVFVGNEEMGKGFIIAEEGNDAIVLLFPKDEYECFCISYVTKRKGKWIADEDSMFYNIEKASLEMNKSMTKTKVSFTIDMEI